MLGQFCGIFGVQCGNGMGVSSSAISFRRSVMIRPMLHIHIYDLRFTLEIQMGPPDKQRGNTTRNNVRTSVI